MKKILHLILAASLLLVIISTYGVASAAFDPFGTTCTADTAGSSVCIDKNNTTNPLIGTNGILIRAVQIITFVTGVASVIIIILSGFKYVTANGDSNSVNSAKNTLLYAVIGLIISMLSQGIVLFVINRV